MGQDDGGSEILHRLHESSRVSGEELEYLMNLDLADLQRLDAAAESAELGESSWRAYGVVKSRLLRRRKKVDDDTYWGRLEALGLDPDTPLSDRNISLETEDEAFAPGWEWVLLFAGVLLLAGSFLPWFHAQAAFASVDRNGMQLGKNEGFSWNGLATLLVGAEAIVIAIGRLTHTTIPSWLRRSPGLLGLVALVGAIDGETGASNLASQVRSNFVSTSVGYGVWLAIVGAALVVLAAVVPWIQARRQARAFSHGDFRGVTE